MPACPPTSKERTATSQADPPTMFRWAAAEPPSMRRASRIRLRTGCCCSESDSTEDSTRIALEGCRSRMRTITGSSLAPTAPAPGPDCPGPGLPRARTSDTRGRALMRLRTVGPLKLGAEQSCSSPRTDTDGLRDVVTDCDRVGVSNFGSAVTVQAPNRLCALTAAMQTAAASLSTHSCAGG